MEEAKELLDRRNNRTPATNHLAEEEIAARSISQAKESRPDVISKPQRQAQALIPRDGTGGKGKIPSSTAPPSAASTSGRDGGGASGASTMPRSRLPPPPAPNAAPKGVRLVAAEASTTRTAAVTAAVTAAAADKMGGQASTGLPAAAAAAASHKTDAEASTVPAAETTIKAEPGIPHTAAVLGAIPSEPTRQCSISAGRSIILVGISH